VFDASVKSPVGIEYGVEYQFGNFDECIEITTDLEHDGADIQSKYCLVDVALEGYHNQKAAVRRNHQVSLTKITLLLKNVKLIKMAIFL
jgi:Nose resistant-to-fluoxetine protein, N-terminal domain